MTRITRCLAALLLGLYSFALITTPLTPSGAAGAVYAAPTGTGKVCSQAVPCALPQALLAAGDGGTVLLESGQYPPTTLNHSVLDGYNDNVTVQPDVGASPVLGNVRSYTSHITFSGIESTGAFYFTNGSHDIEVTNSHIYGPGATVLIRGSNETIDHDLIEGGSAKDGVQIGGYPSINSNIVIADNTIRDFTSLGNQYQHPDCVQLFDTSNILIKRNHLYNCYNSAITMSPGSRRGITNVTVEANFLESCQTNCGNGGSAVDMRTTQFKSGIVFDHNTVAKGSVRLPANPAVEASGNIIGYMSISKPCLSALTDSLIGDYSRALCKNGLPGSGNVLGTASYVDTSTDDLHLTASVPVFSDLATPSYTDIDGQYYGSPPVVGADTRRK